MIPNKVAMLSVTWHLRMTNLMISLGKQIVQNLNLTIVTRKILKIYIHNSNRESWSFDSNGKFIEDRFVRKT